MFGKIKSDFLAYGRNSRNKLFGYFVAMTTLGFYVMLFHRVGSAMERLGIVGIAIGRLWDLLCNMLSGCYISPRAHIQGGLYLPHANGIVIGIGTRLGSNCTVYQHVTLGSRAKGEKAYPIIGDNVCIFPNAVVVGAISIGDGAVIGAGSVVISDVPAGAVAVGNPARIVLKRSSEITSQ